MRLSPSIVLLRTQSDERLTALARDGSEPAFTALVERYRSLVLRTCRRVLPEARAEDATQQAFVAAWRALSRGDDVRDIRPWLLRIARNTALNALRTPGYEYEELAESLQGGTAPPAELERREVVRQTLAGLAALPENQREALLRSAIQGAAHADIARDLGLTEGATRQLVLRARASLRAAASAITPLPLVNWAAAGSSSGVGEMAAGGSAAGASALLAKAGAVAVIAGGAVATPAVVHHFRHSRPRTAAHTSTVKETADRAAATPTPVRAATRTVSAHGTPAPVEQRRHRHHGSAAHTVKPAPAAASHSSSGPGSGSGSSGSSGSSGHSGGGESEGHGNSGHGSEGSGDSGATPEPTEAPEATETPEASPTPGATETESESENEGHGHHGGGNDDGGGHSGGKD